jgi:hypothetical protein
LLYGLGFADIMGMSVRKMGFFLVICLATGVAFGQSPIDKFAKESLALDLASTPFGTALDRHFQPWGRQGLVLPPLWEATTNENSLDWYESEASTNYAKNFPNRKLVFGFKDGRLAAVRITLTSMLNEPNDSENVKAARLELQKVQDALLNSSAQHKLNFEDGSLRTLYSATCGTTPDSLFYSVIQIMPARKSP